MLLALLCSVQEAWAQTWYSNSTSDNFNNPASWSANPDGTGGNPPSSAFTSGTDNFVVQNLHTRTIDAPITINSLTVAAGGTVDASGGSLTLNGNLINNGDF